MAEHRVREIARRCELLVVLTELLAEKMVDRSKHLRARAVVEGQRQVLRGALAAVAEYGIVADKEHIVRPRPGSKQVDDVALQTVGVLELVDHQRAEAQLLRLAHLLVVLQELAREQLQVFEVERRLALLCGGVLRGEKLEQLLQEILVAFGELVERGLLEPLARVAERGSAVAGRRKDVSEVEQLRRVRPQRQRGVRRRELFLGHAGVGGERPGCLLEVGQSVGDARLLAELQLELATCGAQRLVDAGEHPPQPLGAIGREQPQPFRIARRAERR